jgi:hypothetical protein
MGPMAMSKAAARGAAYENFPAFLRSRHKAKLLDKWMRGEQYSIDPIEYTGDGDESFHGRPFAPSRVEVTEEFTDLGTRTPTPWAGLVVRSLAQTCYVDGMRMPGSNENMEAWKTWQANRWDAKQGPLHHTAIGTGAAYGIVLPGKDPLTGDKMARMLARSPKALAPFYDTDDDEWCMFAIEGHKRYERNAYSDISMFVGWTVRVYDEDVTHYLSCKGDGHDPDDWEYISYEEHGMPVPPVARLVNRLDLDGRATGEIEPVLPLLRRIDQDVFDRLIVQRFGAWKVRYIAGMAKPGANASAAALELSLMDFLASGDPQTKFGTLDATDLKPFGEVTDADLRMLAAITQTPPHHLLGLSSNLQAEALAAAESGLQRKSSDFKMNAGEFHEQMARMTAMVNGNRKEAAAFDMQVRWRDTESRSLTQAADALGKMAVQLKIPVEMLWERLPGWTDQDTERAEKIIEQGGIDQLLEKLAGAMEAEKAELLNDAVPPPPPAQGPPSGQRG